MTLYYAYGIPDVDEIQHNDAVGIAENAVREKYQLSDEQMNRYQVFCESFDISGKLHEGHAVNGFRRSPKKCFRGCLICETAPERQPAISVPEIVLFLSESILRFRSVRPPPRR